MASEKGTMEKFEEAREIYLKAKESSDLARRDETSARSTLITAAKSYNQALQEVFKMTKHDGLDRE